MHIRQRALVQELSTTSTRAVTATIPNRGMSSTSKSFATPLSPYGGVHGGKSGASKMWRNKPLLRREGDRIFKTGIEASSLLISEAGRKDGDCSEFMSSWEGMAHSLSVVFDRHPKYAWVLKLLTEAERTISFRVAWIDDTGIRSVAVGSG